MMVAGEKVDRRVEEIGAGSRVNVAIRVRARTSCTFVIEEESFCCLASAIIVLAGPCVDVHGLKEHIGFVDHVSYTPNMSFSVCA